MIERRTPMKRVAMKPRRKALAPRSPKRQLARLAEVELTELVFRRDGGCILREQTSHRCFGPPTAHHLLKASAGGGWTEDNIVCLCAGANTMVEDQPDWARNMGLVIRWGITPDLAWERRVAAGLIVRTDCPDP